MDRAEEGREGERVESSTNGLVQNELDEGVKDGELRCWRCLLVCLLGMRWLNVLRKGALQEILPTINISLAGMLTSPLLRLESEAHQ